MKYTTAAAFRMALEQQLNRIACRTNASNSGHLRKIVTIDRYMARLLVVAPDRWIIKGGVAGVTLDTISLAKAVNRDSVVNWCTSQNAIPVFSKKVSGYLVGRPRTASSVSIPDAI